MKTLKTALVLVLGMAISGTVIAQPRDGLGIGIIIGEPTGLSLKKWLDNTRAVDAGIAWSFSENDSLHLHADYLLHGFDVISAREAKGRFPVHAGLGARIKFKDSNNGRGRNDNDALVGVRVPFGVSFLPAGSPIDLFAEIVPILDVAPRSDFDLNAAIGARFYF